jgi:hypothetical protein
VASGHAKNASKERFFGGFPSLEITFHDLIYACNQALPGISSGPVEVKNLC